MTAAKRLLEKVTFTDGPYDAATAADALVIVTEWDAFRALDLERLKTIMRSPILVDIRNIYKPTDVARSWFSYTSVGRPMLDGRVSRSKAAE
jgi:UDPglucose 6-dehydrogenase